MWNDRRERARRLKDGETPNTIAGRKTALQEIIVFSTVHKTWFLECRFPAAGGNRIIVLGGNPLVEVAVSLLSGPVDAAQAV